MSTTIGIDLGTYNSEIAYVRPNGEIVILESPEGPTIQGNTIPSFVQFDKNGELVKYGEPAREAMGYADKYVIWGLKRLFGRSYQEATNCDEIHRFKYVIGSAHDGSITIQTGNKTRTPMEITKIFLEKLKEHCESTIGKKVDRAVISHPAYFHNSQIKAVKYIAEQIGFENVDLITEPEAAAIAYKDKIDFNKEPWVMVIDWGAGTLDIAINKFSIDKGRGIPIIETIRPPYGDTRLGGLDMDDALFKDAIRVYNLKDIDNAELAVEFNKMRLQIENCKIELSQQPWTVRNTPYHGKTMKLKMARSKSDIPLHDNDKEGWIILGDVLKDILEKFKDKIVNSLKKDDLTPNDIDQILFVGGPMNMLCVRKIVADIFRNNSKVNPQPKELEREDFTTPINYMEAVVRGAAIYSGLKDTTGQIGQKLIIGAPKVSHRYGYIIDYEFLGQKIKGKEILTLEGTSIIKDTFVAKGKILPLRLPSGDAISFSILEIEDGKYFADDEYKFYPTTRDVSILESIGCQTCNIQPYIELNKDRIATLKIEDLFANKGKSLSLQLSKSDRVEIREDSINDIDIMIKEQENLASKKVSEIVAIDNGGRGGFGGGDSNEREKNWIEESKVTKAREDGITKIRYVESIMDRCKDKKDVMNCYRELKEALEKLPHRAVSKSEQGLFNDVGNYTTNLKNALDVAGLSR